MKQRRRKTKEGTSNVAEVELEIENGSIFVDLSTTEKREVQGEKSSKANPKLYFNSDTQDAIVSFQTEKNKKIRDAIYVNDILPAFEKLVENLINIHKFTGIFDSYDDLKNDCVNFLFETIHKFDAARGTNAFSYFNVVAKNWLIIKTKQKTQKIKRNISVDDPNGLTVYESMIVDEHNSVPSQDTIFEQGFFTEETLNLLHEIRSRTRSENELICINSIITIFENIEEIDLLNKGAVLLYMRELSGLTPKQLTTTMQSIKKHYKKIRIDLKK